MGRRKESDAAEEMAKDALSNSGPQKISPDAHKERLYIQSAMALKVVLGNDPVVVVVEDEVVVVPVAHAPPQRIKYLSRERARGDGHR